MHADWRRYPFSLVPGDPQLDFPAAEANHTECESDTWFLAGELTGESGRRFAFLSIVNKNRPGGAVVADFYTLALFDLDDSTYATFTDYDMPPANMAPGAKPKLSAGQRHLDLVYESEAGTVRWHTCRDASGDPIPFTYDAMFVGTDPKTDDAMRLTLHVRPTRPPVPLGAATYNGRIECFGQPGTYSYFQTGMAMAGTLRWGPVSERVSGTAGHIDRQWFPVVANGGGPTGDMRWRAHEWRTVNLDSGVDLSIWHQFDRTERNAPQPFSGATLSHPDDSAPEYADDVEVTVTSYVRWPESVRTLVPPPSAARYLPDRHRLTSRALELDLVGEPLIPAPAHALPLEYMEGPYRYRGTFRGRPVDGFAFYERSLALWRDWELVDVLAAASSEQLAAPLRTMIDSGRRREAVTYIETDVRPGFAQPQLLDDLVAALSRD
ncbi:lipocalin-like domain-containing protein [Mycobacterium sp. E740]|uniref:lipocalin-like domain-containing protein n=1 Tax=Mycobacterium sp. E740 TaxID=1834149 RepID=UPI0007FF921F|nr:lipocalin-like domain-containing protein [Mycobacterium sp. E740]OBI84638.1 secreted hydrolase [Mycobacterium sp. E740]